MIRNIHSSPIAVFISDDETDSNTESDSSGLEWLGPENQLGLEDPFRLERDDQVEVDKVEVDKGEIQQVEETGKY